MIISFLLRKRGLKERCVEGGGAWSLNVSVKTLYLTSLNDVEKILNISKQFRTNLEFKDLILKQKYTYVQ